MKPYAEMNFTQAGITAFGIFSYDQVMSRQERERAYILPGGPMLYAWVRPAEGGLAILYFGSTRDIDRPLGRKHATIKMEPGDLIIIWWFENLRFARELEQQLLTQTKPPHNIAKNKGATLHTPIPEHCDSLDPETPLILTFKRGRR